MVDKWLFIGLSLCADAGCDFPIYALGLPFFPFPVCVTTAAGSIRRKKKTFISDLALA
jgi:hypothetical protein